MAQCGQRARGVLDWQVSFGTFRVASVWRCSFAWLLDISISCLTVVLAAEVSSGSSGSPWEGVSKLIRCFSKGVVLCSLQEMVFTPCVAAGLASWLFSKLDS